MLEYFSVGTEREKLVAPKKADPNMLKPIRNLDLRSLSSQAKSKGMGDGKENVPSLMLSNKIMPITNLNQIGLTFEFPYWLCQSLI